MQRRCCAGMRRCSGARHVKRIAPPSNWDEFCRVLHEQFWPENYSRRGGDELAEIWQYNRDTVADVVFHFRATCLKIADLEEPEKLDRFVRTLVPDVRLQVELRGPRDFHEAAMFAERADAVISRIPDQDSQRNWQNKKYKSPPP